MSEGNDDFPFGLEDLLRKNFAGELHRPEPVPGMVVDKWELTRRLGSGGFGSVFEAWHLELDQAFAIKFLDGRHTGLDARQAFLEEARLMSQMRGRHLIRVLHFAELPDGVPYYVMDLVKGPSLREHLRLPLSVPESIEILEGILEGLCEVHVHGYVHGDLKPENIALSDSGIRVRLLDFGLARTSALVGRGIGGTPPYMAPETVLEGSLPDARSDLYAVGVVFYEMVAGRLPRGHRTMELDGIRQSWSRKPNSVPMRVHRPEVPEDLDRLIMDALSKEPGGRPPTAEVMLHRLRSSRSWRGPRAGEGRWPKGYGLALGLFLPVVALTTFGIAKGLGPSNTFDEEASRSAEIVDELMVVEAKPSVAMSRTPEGVRETSVESVTVEVEDSAPRKQGSGSPDEFTLARKKRKRRRSPDDELLADLRREIEAKCAALMDAGERMTVLFLVAENGEIDLLTASLKNAAGDCAKAQVRGTRFPPRVKSTPLTIIVE